MDAVAFDPFANAWSQPEPSWSSPSATDGTQTDDHDHHHAAAGAGWTPTAPDAHIPQSTSALADYGGEAAVSPVHLTQAHKDKDEDEDGEWATTHLPDKSWHDDNFASAGDDVLPPVWTSSMQDQSSDHDTYALSARPSTFTNKQQDDNDNGDADDDDVWKASARDRHHMALSESQAESESIEHTSSQSWLTRVDDDELNDQDRAVLSFAKSAATDRSDFTHKQPELQSAMSKLYNQLQIPPAISTSATAFQQSEVYRLAKEAMQATSAAAAGATASLANSARGAIKPAAPATGMSSLYASAEEEQVINAELFAPVKLPSMPKVNLSAIANDISAKSKSMLDYVTGSGEPDLASLESELGVPVRNLDSEAASRANTTSVPTPPASKWTFFSNKKRNSTDVATHAASAVSASPRASLSSPSMQTASDSINAKATTAALAPARFWRFGGKVAADEATSDKAQTATARSSLDVPPARSSSDIYPIPAKASDLALDDFSMLENFDSRRPSTNSTNTAAGNPTTATMPTPYASAGMSIGMTQTSSKDSDTMAELDSLPITGSSRWAFWNRSGVPLPPMNLGNTGKGQHVAIGAQSNVTQHEPDIDELFAAFETPATTSHVKPTEVFDGSLSAIAKAAPQLDGLEDPYARLSIKDAKPTLKQIESKVTPSVLIDDLDSFLTGPAPAPVSPSKTTTIQPTQQPVVQKPLPLLAPPPSGLRRVSTPKQSLLDEFGD